MIPARSRPAGWYLPFLILTSGLGGLLAGIDFGIIAGALLYLDKTIPMTDAQQGFMVSIYVFGGLIAALFAGALADSLGRKRMMVAGGLMFVVSILLIFISSGYAALLAGRILMGLSGGVICVVVPLYMAECLPSEIRGRGTSAFQFFMTVGFVLAAVIANWSAGVHDQAVAAAAGDADKIFAADDAAWRRIFLAAVVPGVLFSLAAMVLRESPRWLFQRHRPDDAERVLALSRPPAQVALEMREMRERSGQAAAADAPAAPRDRLLQRKYVVPFILACVILACNQATGINSILAYAARIFQGAGLTEKGAAANLQVITGINVVVTLLGALLVDKAGRKVLLTIGTAGIVACLAAAGLVFHGFESQRVDVLPKVAAAVAPDGRHLSIAVDAATLGALDGDQPGQLSVAYKFERDTKPRIAAAFSNAADPADRVLTIRPEVEKKWVTVEGRKVEEAREKDLGPIRLLRAKYGPLAAPDTGRWVVGLLCAFIAFFAVGPGVCVWLALSELMPTRIRSKGMGIAMVLNNGVQFLSALFFPIVVASHGFYLMFFIWGGCTVVYFLTALLFLPETKGRTLEEIEDHFARKHPPTRPGGAEDP